MDGNYEWRHCRGGGDLPLTATVEIRSSCSPHLDAQMITEPPDSASATGDCGLLNVIGWYFVGWHGCTVLARCDFQLQHTKILHRSAKIVGLRSANVNRLFRDQSIDICLPRRELGSDSELLHVESSVLKDNGEISSV